MRSRPTPPPSASARTLAALAAVLSLALSASAGGAAVLSNPHAFMAEEKGCVKCHQWLPLQGKDEDFVKGIEDICGDCHGGGLVFHPMNVRPRIHAKVPLPLDESGRMTCVTCHDPHGEPYADIAYVQKDLLEWLKGIVRRSKHRTYFLRMPNDRGQLCGCCHDPVELAEQIKGFTPPPAQDYRGSTSCRPCHEERYLAWRLTCHARTHRDPTATPGIARADFTQIAPFPPQQIVRTVGTHRVQRYVLERSGARVVPVDVWSLADRRWEKRPPWKEHSWREQCAGCHDTGYNPYLETLAEESVGCEACHGPGGRHVDSKMARDIVNPARLDAERRDSICASCHTRGHDRTGQFFYPVGYKPGDDLGLFFRGLIPPRDQPKETHTGDGTLEDRLRAFQFWVDGFLGAGADSDLCRNYRLSASGDPDFEPSLGFYCLTCHDAAAGTAAHAPFEWSGSNCYRCHRPLLDRAGWPSVHDHKFAFGPSRIVRVASR